MKKEKKASSFHESLQIKQAQNKNYGLEEHQKLISKIYDQEKQRRADDIDKERKRIQKDIRKARKISSVPGYALNNLHRRRAENIEKMCMHVVSCYMLRMEKNKRMWHHKVTEGELADRPVQSPDHLMFIKNKFPETLTYVKEIGYAFKHDRKADIFEHARAGHDMKCYSTRVKSVGETLGAYPKKESVNVRFWQPKPEDLRLTTRDRFYEELIARSPPKKVYRQSKESGTVLKVK